MIMIPVSLLTPFSAEEWERVPCELIAQTVGPTDVVLDAGAGAGKTTLCAARLAARVVAYEPHPDIAALWRAASDRMPPNVRLVESMLTVEDGPAKLYMNSEFWNSGATVGGPYGEWEKEPVTVNGVSILRAINGSGATVVLLDVEGGEADLLPPVASCAGVRAIIVEFHGLRGTRPVDLGSGWLMPTVIGDGHLTHVVYKRED